MYQHLTECKMCAENMPISFCFCKTCVCRKILENLQISVNMIDRLDITDEYSVNRDLILNTVIFIDAALNFLLKFFENVMFYDFIYLAKGFRMRPKVRSTLKRHYCNCHLQRLFFNQPMIVALLNMSKAVFAYPSSAFVGLRGNCTIFQLDNIVNRIQHAFSFKMMYRNLRTQRGATNSVISPLI